VHTRLHPLNIAAEKGVVVGRLIFSDNGDMIDCTKMGMGGKAIPPNIDRVGNMQSDALFILLVEKDAARRICDWPRTGSTIDSRV
jgi:DNA topoisomerase VI subunit A